MPSPSRMQSWAPAWLEGALQRPRLLPLIACTQFMPQPCFRPSFPLPPSPGLARSCRGAACPHRQFCSAARPQMHLLPPSERMPCLRYSLRAAPLPSRLGFSYDLTAPALPPHSSVHQLQCVQSQSVSVQEPELGLRAWAMEQAAATQVASSPASNTLARPSAHCSHRSRRAAAQAQGRSCCQAP